MADHQADQTSYDAILLGSSPILLIEAVMRARRGHRVVVVEEQDQLGGCWRSAELFEVRDVEGACHLLENYRGAYAFLEQVVGLPLHPCDPAPEVLYPNGRRVPYVSRVRILERLMSILARMPVVAAARCLEWATAGRLLFRRTARFRLMEGARRLRTLVRHPFVHSARRRGVKYFEGGGPRMLATLREEMQRLEVRVVHARATTLGLPSPGVVHLQLDADRGRGEVLVGRELVVTESACLDSIVTSDRVRRFERVDTVHDHLLLEVEGLAADLLSYVQLPGDPFIPRVSDVTGFCTGFDEGSGRRVLVVQLYRPPCEDFDELTAFVMNYLRERGLVPRSARAIRARQFDIRSPSSSPDAAGVLRDMARAEISVLPSRGDLCLTILQNGPRWLAIPPGPGRAPREPRDEPETDGAAAGCAREGATLP